MGNTQARRVASPEARRPLEDKNITVRVSPVSQQRPLPSPVVADRPIPDIGPPGLVNSLYKRQGQCSRLPRGVCNDVSISGNCDGFSRDCILQETASFCGDVINPDTMEKMIKKCSVKLPQVKDELAKRKIMRMEEEVNLDDEDDTIEEDDIITEEVDLGVEMVPEEVKPIIPIKPVKQVKPIGTLPIATTGQTIEKFDVLENNVYMLVILILLGLFIFGYLRNN